jgi:uncharacterized protein (DUF433 family)
MRGARSLFRLCREASRAQPNSIAPATTVSGARVFRGMRMPVTALFENLEDGAQVDRFVQRFPGVSLEQARTVLEHAAQRALTSA